MTSTVAMYAVPVVNEARAEQSAANCDDYFRLKEQGFGAVSDQDHDILRTEGVRCEAIKRLGKMKPGCGEPAKALLSDSELLHKLPATVGPSISNDERALREQSVAQGKSWLDYTQPLTLERKEGSLVISEADTSSQLRPLASGDVDGDGLQDVLVEGVCSGTEGNWVDIRLLVLSPVINDGPSRYRLSENVLP